MADLLSFLMGQPTLRAAGFVTGQAMGPNWIVVLDHVIVHAVGRRSNRKETMVSEERK